MTVIPTTTLPPKTAMCDYSFSRPVLGALRGAGIKAVIRYLSYSVNGKNLTADEVTKLHAAGLGILVVWENLKGDPLSGAALGAQHGAEAVRQAQTLGYPAGLPIFCAVDFDTLNSVQTQQVVAYVGAFSYACRSNGYQTGFYGGSRLWSKCQQFVDVKCRAAASSWSPASIVWSPEIRQGNTTVIGGGSVDMDWTTISVDVWLPQSTDLPVLQQGSRGNYVRWMQATLAKLGYKITVDGVFGPQTRNFVIWFQTSRNLPPTGIVDQATWTELGKI